METHIPINPTTSLIQNYFLRLWCRYKHFVKNATKGKFYDDDIGIAYWRESLFTRFITYFLPICLIALIPGVLMSLESDNLVIAGFDLLIAGCIVAVSLSIRLNIILRKVFVIFLLYVVAVFFLIYLGLLGPGLVYLLAISMFTALSFSRIVAYFSIGVNLLICVLCSIIISFKLFGSPLTKQCSVGVWIAISSNLIFLSTVSVILISYAVNNLEDKIIKEFLLKNELKLVNDEKVSQNELIMESEQHYKSLFLQSPSPMWILDLTTMKFLQVNDTAIKNYGYTNKDFLNMTVIDLKVEDELALDLEEFIAGLRKDIKTTLSATRITRHQRKNLEQFYVEVTFTAIPFKGREAILTIARDMTLQRNFTEAIESQNAKLTEIAWIQSHVVRAPLARIMGLVDIIVKNDGEKPDPEVLTYLDQSAKEFDEIIKTITIKTENVGLL